MAEADADAAVKSLFHSIKRTAVGSSCWLIWSVSRRQTVGISEPCRVIKLGLPAAGLKDRLNELTTAGSLSCETNLAQRHR